MPNYENKISILHFVSQPSTPINEIKIDIREKYNIGKKYFFLPNQFWKHKNHMVVFEAVKILQNKGILVEIVCTGLVKDFRDNDNNHIDNIKTFIYNNNLQNSIKILGMIDYDEVLWLMKNSISIINPSLFEGWSSTVEESRSMGKPIILSDIDVHKEQNPRCGIFFNPHNPVELSNIFVNLFNNNSSSNCDNNSNIQDDLNTRTLKFANEYQNIIQKIYTEGKL
jgi:glycosyltransferase involved in cell wall biosynthesis